MLCSADLLLPGLWQHREVASNGFRFHVALGERFDTLTGPPVLLLHGSFSSWYAWRHTLPVLDSLGLPVAALDLRGHGASDQPPQGYDAATQAADVAGVITALGHDRATLVGHDLGAVLARATAHFHPDRVIEVHASGRPPRLGPLAARRIEAILRRRVPDEQARRYSATLLSEWPAPSLAIRSARRLRRWRRSDP